MCAPLLRRGRSVALAVDRFRGGRCVRHAGIGRRSLGLARSEVELGSQKSGKGPGTFDFVGFTFCWARSRRGRAIRFAAEWCRRNRHEAVKDQRVALSRKLQGHYAYFGVSGNSRSLQLVYEYVKRNWFKWLCRRSQRRRLTWGRFADLLRQQPLPRPRIQVRIWAP